MNVLLVDDNQGIYSVMKENLGFAGHTLYCASNTENAHVQMKKQSIDAILLDIKLGSENGIDTLKEFKQLYKNTPIIMITGYATVDTAVKSMKEGAFDYLKKPLNFDIMCQLLESAFEASKMKLENAALKMRRIEDLPALTSRDPNFQDIINRAQILASTDLPVVITGENGTGKELLAEYIHRHSERSSQKLHKINCAAFPESLLDNELFGHEKGAYTGADSTFKGIFEQADHATLFLDEIGDMPHFIQVKILRVLQNNEIRRIGGSTTINVNNRYIASTNKDLKELIRQGLFREDLYYRLNAAVLEIPPLRNRKHDIPLLASYFLDAYNRKNNSTTKFLSEKVINLFQCYHWPGNIRELKNVLNYAATVSMGSEITIKDLPPSQDMKKGSTLKISGISPLENQQIELIKKTLSKTGNNKTQAAKILNISRNTLYLKIKRYGID